MTDLRSPAIVLTDVYFRILFINEAVEDMFGYSSKEAWGKKTDIFQGEETDQNEVERIKEGLNVSPFLETDLKIYSKNGDLIQCAFRIHRINDFDGHLNSYLFVEKDSDVLHNAQFIQSETWALDKTLENAEEIPAIVRLLHEYLREEAPFLDPEFSSTQAASQLKMHPSTLSKSVKKACGFGLPALINKYRINYFKRLALQSDLSKITLYGLALASGFKNEATFHRQFKSFEGMSPKVFLATSPVKINLSDR